MSVRTVEQTRATSFSWRRRRKRLDQNTNHFHSVFETLQGYKSKERLQDSLASDEDPSDAQTKEGIDDDVENPLDYAVYVPYEEFVRIVNSNSN